MAILVIFPIINLLNFSRIRKYFNIKAGSGSLDSTSYKMTHFKYKVIDLKLWEPNLHIPNLHRLPKSENVRILHSAYLEKSDRNWDERNIKGSPYVLQAINRLKREGFPVEYTYIKDKPSNEMRFYQVQADIVVEQLIYGWWGSTFIEAASLGKPIVCYIRPEWKKFFFKTFPEHSSLPIVEADTDTIYPILKNLVSDENFRKELGVKTRKFAEAQYDPVRNTGEMIRLLKTIE